ncbi:hypothetical protein Hte_004245 [Hypoxylon texense]
MSEVKEFEHHFRFKKYLAKEDALGQLPFRPKSKTSADQQGYKSTQNDANPSTLEMVSKDLSPPSLLAGPPRRPPKSGADSARSSSQGMPNSSQSGTSSSSNVPRRPGWGNLPIPLPPPFSKDKSRGMPSSSPPPRVVSSGYAAPTPTHDHELGSTNMTGLIFRVYDDSLPASSQPQTPHNLPEARHQSHLHGSYTAPLPRPGSRPAYYPASREGDRSSSGLGTSGFRDFHHDGENTEDSTLFYEESGDLEDRSPEDE